MRTWTMRILGVLNLLFGVGGLCYFAESLFVHWNKWPPSATKCEWAIFAILLVISTYFVVHLGYCGLRLIRSDESAILPSCILFAAGNIGELLSVQVFWLIVPLSMSKIVFGLWEVALSAFDVQVLSGYALFGFVVTLTLLISRRGAKVPIQDVLPVTSASETKS